MPRKACLAIGISDAPPLDYLPGAVNGAKGITHWAHAVGYKTGLLTDEKVPIGIDTVMDALVGKGAPPRPGTTKSTSSPCSSRKW